MPVKTWPANLRGNDGEIYKDGSALLPPKNINRSPMADGAKSARKFTRGWSGFKGRWRFTLAEFAIFEDWVHADLKDGNLQWAFNVPLRGYDVAARFVPQDDRPYVDSPAPGANRFVDFEVEFLDRAHP